MPTSDEQLRDWLDEPEGTRFEFKEAKYKYDFEKLVEYCVALANEGGGKIILGITDRRPRRIVGTSAFPEPGRTEASINERLNQRIPVEEVRTTDGRVLVFHIPSRLPGTAWEINGKYLKRAGDALVPMPEKELRAIFAETDPDFSAEICPGAVVADLDSLAVEDFRISWSLKSGKTRWERWNDSETLVNAELMVDDQLTYAALILFGTHAALGRYLAQAEVVFEYRSSEASGPAADREEYRQGFFLFYNDIWQEINLRNDRQSYREGLFRFDIPTFDEEPVREALLNAVSHRDYRLGGSVFVRQYPRRLEVDSPGGLPNGITLDNILDQQNPRNRRLAETLSKCGLVERSGQGVNLMFENAIKQGKPLPDFSGTSDHQVRLTLNGTVENPAFVRYLEKISEEQSRHFSTYDFLTLDTIYRELPLPEHLKDRIPNLIRAGAVQSIGRGKGTRYILSKALYSELGAKGVHTRKKGLDHETNKTLLEQHLRSQSKTGAALSELVQVLPALSESKIQLLLNELREEGRVELNGLRRWARWHPSDPKDLLDLSGR